MLNISCTPIHSNRIHSPHHHKLQLFPIKVCQYTQFHSKIFQPFFQIPHSVLNDKSANCARAEYKAGLQKNNYLCY
ncbi:hypothetical protein THIOM_001471 [Candidatus Thiomargarita nelsonii]|uniref:Uncharacterized protein n=1 Tax=Candidatus Thiomargarita nelsonii TaxID=1003181 RepID=A0A176S3S3_9GAMM|nr:hypothetical protein THIOM_001471 [Candidatus Thiomargarita nelsonii]